MFSCKRCEKCFDRKYDYIRHLEKKKPCQMKHSVLKRPEEFRCNNCAKEYSSQSNLNKHMRTNKICKMQRSHAEKQDQLLEKMNAIQEQLLNRPQTVINNVQNVQNVQNVNLNINFVRPGEESIDHIDKAKLLECLSHEDFSKVIKELMRLVYFNKDAPENSHWCVGYPKDKFGALQYNIETSIIDRMVTKETINFHFENMCYLLAEKMNELMRDGELSICQLRNINKFYQYVGSDSIQEGNTLECVKMMAYNNRMLAVDLWKHLQIRGEHNMLKQV